MSHQKVSSGNTNARRSKRAWQSKWCRLLPKKKDFDE